MVGLSTCRPNRVKHLMSQDRDREYEAFIVGMPCLLPELICGAAIGNIQLSRPFGSATSGQSRMIACIVASILERQIERGLAGRKSILTSLMC